MANDFSPQKNDNLLTAAGRAHELLHLLLDGSFGVRLNPVLRDHAGEVLTQLDESILAVEGE